jgi:hypothetical protein
MKGLDFHFEEFQVTKSISLPHLLFGRSFMATYAKLLVAQQFCRKSRWNDQSTNRPLTDPWMRYHRAISNIETQATGLP